MSADFWAGYISGAAGIIIGNPLDLLKVRLQAGTRAPAARPLSQQFENAGTLVRGVAAPVLGYGALNALLFVSYNRTLSALGESPAIPSNLWKVWCAGAVGGLATWVVSAPTELIKCCAQTSHDGRGSWAVIQQVWKDAGLKGLYTGGTVTSVRDAIGYGFYFWSYELCKQWMNRVDQTDAETAAKVLLCGGVAGVVTWASIFPLDVIKTRVQIQALRPQNTTPAESERSPLLHNTQRLLRRRKVSALDIARQAYAAEGVGVFFCGLGVCSARAFLVNAVQWALYEWIMSIMKHE